jgi:exosortase/archaeosortase
LMITAAKYQTVIAWYVFCLLSGKKIFWYFLHFLLFNIQSKQLFTCKLSIEKTYWWT